MKLKNPKRKGIAFENRVRRYLEEKGWFVVRQASSTFPDLIGISPRTLKRKSTAYSSSYHSQLGAKNTIKINTKNMICAIECKVRKTGLLPNEISKLMALQRNYGMIAVFAYQDDDKNICLEYIDCPDEIVAFHQQRFVGRSVQY